MTPEMRGGARGVRAQQLVGRERERRALDAALDRALRFEAPQFVTIVGALGLGKSRLLDTWTHGLEQAGTVRVVRATARRPEMGGEPEALSLFAEVLRARFGVDERIDREGALRTFRAELQNVFGDRRVTEVAGFLGRFLGFELPESPLGQALSLRPEQQAELARAVLCRFLEEDARARPLVLALEDLHEADEASLDLFSRLAAELADAPLAVVATARPELYVRRPEWGRGEGSHARVELTPLSPLEMDVFIKAALGTAELAPGLATRAAVEAGGNPFLLEQLLRVYLQHGFLVAETGDTWTFDLERAEREAPGLGPEAAAEARLRELGPAERELLARASAFGPVFWTGGVIALGRQGAEPLDATTVFAPDPSIDEVRRMFTSLEERGFLHRLSASAIPGDTEWAFADANERALLASSLDPEALARRKRFAAQWIEARATATSERLELVGYLYEEGGDPRRAGQRFVSAGDEALRALRHDRARTLYLRGIRLLEADDSVLRLETFHKLGDVAARLGRSREALAHFGEMLRVAWRMDLPGKGGAAHARIGRLHRALGDYRKALQHLDLARVLFELAGDRPGIAATLDDVGRVHFLTGNPELSMRCHRAALAVRDELGDQRGKSLTLSWMGLVEAQAGRLAEAQRCVRQALELGRAARDAHRIVFSLVDLAGLDREAGQVERALAILEEARRMAREMGEGLYECHVALHIGECHVLAGRPEQAEEELSAAKELAQKFGARRLVAEANRAIAEARLAHGDVITARNLALEALSLAEAMGASPLAGAALRVLATAVVRGAPGDADRGGPREMFDRAVELLGEAGAELELGRTFFAYAEFEERGGRGSVALELRDHARGIRDRSRSGLTVAPA